MKKLSIVNWNVQRKNFYIGFTSLKKIREHLSTLESDIIILQEMCNAKKTLDGLSNLNLYNIFIPKINDRKYNRKEGYNFNVILSRYPIVESKEIIFPKFNQKEILQNCTRIKIKLDKKHLLIYNCQLTIIKAGMATRLKQLEYILDDAKKHKGPVLISGDMNDVVPKAGWKRGLIETLDREPKNEMFIDGKLITYEEKKLFMKTIKKYGFEEALKLNSVTWSPIRSRLWEAFKLKLDWFMVRNMKVKNIKLHDYITDHKSIEAEVGI
jgi:endonuclease/exonuclease/phosphatase family metal-dependent hydrolase